MESNTWKERIIMPIQNGKYVSPNWQNGGPPALNAAELNAICQSLQADDQQIKDNLPRIIQSIASGVFLNSSGQLVNKAGSQITVPSSQLSDQVHIVTGSYVGTGTFGADHPCSLTFNFLPSLIWLFGAGFSSMAWNSQVLANKSIVSPGDLTSAYQKYPFPFSDGYQSGGGAYPYEYILEHYAAFQSNTLRWYTKYTQKSGNSQPVEVDSAAYQLNAAGAEYGWIAFG